MLNSLFSSLLLRKMKKQSGAHFGSNPRIQINKNDIEFWMKEWKLFIENKGILGIPIDEISEDQAHLNLDKKWLAHFIYGFGHFTLNAKSDFPELTKFIEKNKNKISLVFFSTLNPDKIIPPHKGNNPYVLRTQIGISINEPSKTCLKVKNTAFNIGNGEVCYFDDTLTHQAWNHSKSPRTVLIIDVLKKPPFILYYFWKKKQRAMDHSDYVQNAIKKLKI